MTGRTRIEPATLHKMWALLTQLQRRSAAILMGLVTIGMLVETLGVGLVMPAFALMTRRDAVVQYPALQTALDWFGDPGPRGLVVGGVLMLVGVFLAKAVFLAGLARYQAHFVFGVQAELSARLFGLYLHQPYSFHMQRNSAQLIHSVNNDTGAFAMNGVQAAITLLSESLVLLGLGALLLFVEPIGTSTMMGVLAVAAWVFKWITGGLAARAGVARRYHNGMLLQHLQEGLGAVKDAKLLGREAEFLRRFHRHDNASAHSGATLTILQQLPRLWLELLAVIGFAVLVVSMVVQARTLDTIVATVALFAAAVFRLIPSVNRILGALHSLTYGVLSIDALHAEFSLSTPDSARATGRIGRLRESLELRGIGFTYAGAAQPALAGLSLTIRRGESVGLVGASGAGKSTLVDIVLGLLSPEAGQTMADGVDIHQDVRGWQDQIGYVPQSVFLSDDSLARNVAFGVPDEDIDWVCVKQVIRAAQLEAWVHGLPDGLETRVGERGVRLSGGQRQRIGIARALYHDPAVLVLDEATSSLDSATEREVLQAIRALHGDKTILIVAHRPSTVEQCDRVYTLANGRVVESQHRPIALDP